MPSAKQAMITNQLINRGIFEKGIIDIFSSIDRTDFVPATFKRSAYIDIEIPLFNSVILRPFVIAKILQFIFSSMKDKEAILVIGDVSGYTGTLFANISKICVIGSINNISTEYLRNKVSLKVMQIYDIKEKFDLVFFDSGFYKKETIIDISHKILKPDGCIIKISTNLSSEFLSKQFKYFDVLVSAEFISESIKILEMPLFLNTNYIA